MTVAVQAAEAAIAARAGGQRVEMLDQRSETGQTFANPDGTFTAEEHLRPQRVRRAAGTWTPVDPTLHRNSDGTISPAATTVAMTFSGGGQAPMATMAAQGRTMSLSFPAPLPPPVLNGNIATYPEILPGVDLRIVADVDRFTHIFVIKTSAAAASAAVRRLTVNTAFSGVNLRPEASGALEAVDVNGSPVFRGASPLMWDSRDKKLAEQGIVADPRQAKVGTQVRAGRLVLQPDTSMLDDHQAVYPLYVDPEWSYVTGTRSHWTVVRASEPTTLFFDRTSIASSDGSYGMMRAGFNDFEGPSYKDRSMWQMNISAVKYTHINSAKFVLTHQWSGAGCSDGTKRWTDLHHLNSTFSSSTTWSTSWNTGGSGWGATLSSSSAIRRYGYSCGPQQVEFPVASQVATEAAAGSSYLWVGLRARSETDKYSWKRYKNDAFVSIQYNRLPNAPAPIAGAATDGKACAAGVTRPWVTTATPILAARQSDSDTGQSTLTTTFYWWPVGGSRIDDANHRVAYSAANNATASPTIPSGLLADGSAYVWQARTWDGIDNGQWSAVCEFNADLSPPNDPGAITAGFYNPGVATGGPGIADTFTFNPPATKASEVTGYAYTIDGGTAAAAGVQVNTVDPTAFAGAATIAPTHDGTTTLRVWTKDRAGRYSANASTFTLLVSSGGLAASYTFEGATPTTDTTGHANTLSLSASSRYARTARRCARLMTISRSPWATLTGPSRVNRIRLLSPNAETIQCGRAHASPSRIANV